MSAVYMERIRKDPVSPGDRRVNKKRRIAANKKREANKRYKRSGCSDIRRAFGVHPGKQATRLAAACAKWHAHKADVCANVAQKNVLIAKKKM